MKNTPRNPEQYATATNNGKIEDENRSKLRAAKEANKAVKSSHAQSEFADPTKLELPTNTVKHKQS